MKPARKPEAALCVLREFFRTIDTAVRFWFRPKNMPPGANLCRQHGPGIPPERAPNVFERFYRARGDEQTPGHGLGLSIARELARAHGGDLTLTRAQSDWTEFCLRLSASSIQVQTQKPPLVTQK
jgi:signal transduction histidine kinase